MAYHTAHLTTYQMAYHSYATHTSCAVRVPSSSSNFLLSLFLHPNFPTYTCPTTSYNLHPVTHILQRIWLGSARGTVRGGGRGNHVGEYMAAEEAVAVHGHAPPTYNNAGARWSNQGVG